MASRGQMEGWFERRSQNASLSVRVENEVSAVLFDGASRATLSNTENWEMIVVTLIMKKVAKFSAVTKLDRGGGARGG